MAVSASPKLTAADKSPTEEDSCLENGSAGEDRPTTTTSGSKAGGGGGASKESSNGGSNAGFGALVRIGLLTVLTVQNAGQTVAIKLAQTQGSHPDSLIVMLLAEIVKVAVSMMLFFFTEADQSWKQYFMPAALRRSMKLVPTAFLFALQNQLLFVGVHNLDPPVFQALSQLKILSAGVFSVALLGKTLSQVQWVALLLLACGAALVQMESSLCKASAAASSATGAAPSEEDGPNPFKGFLAVLGTAALSGLAGCYTELMLKTEKLPMWLQSAQVALASALILTFLVVYERTTSYSNAPLSNDIFADALKGFVPMTWLVICTISLGGIVVVAVLRYADNLLKGMSMVFSLLLSGVLSVIMFSTSIGSVFCIAAVIICSSVFLYQHAPAPPSAQRKPEEKKAPVEAGSWTKGTSDKQTA